MNEKENLNPCPKCGGEVHIEVEDCDFPCYEFVVCEKCGYEKTYHLDDGVKQWNGKEGVDKSPKL